MKTKFTILVSGFHQIELDPKDIDKTVFNVYNGHFEYKQISYVWFKNTRATFQCVMDNILTGIQNERARVYMDDIIVHSSFLEEQNKRLTEIFQKTQQRKFNTIA